MTITDHVSDRTPTAVDRDPTRAALAAAFEGKALLTMGEAAGVLRLSVRTLRLHVARGDIAFVTEGAGAIRPRKRFAFADLDQFVQRQRRRMQPIQRPAPRINVSVRVRPTGRGG
ncbi:MAG TPA: helix-turn-helix domain-containing protein [Methylosinus sp.]|jgi:hypothetical protein|uniref:helix-turn-helix domain-containing protein n=1 Tax=Methylosinus sp. TaxID=427 RepID=UPI002F9301D6